MSWKKQKEEKIETSLPTNEKERLEKCTFQPELDQIS